ncbi:Flp pilus assembly protein TadG [Sphingomonas kaistensis]|uniref:Flp pilus assembly protein TadG n=1 Tax=Sphingomonas kaistensis TaxID=298708 RepID=A0A7X6BGY0_9SPHN|nr:pilus assembly protein TadG-related protein [Sphingomonas kaistensis]NJC06909.1 Flp pilus assembly protein TadG [Sphingomonas kaistensis]
MIWLTQSGFKSATVNAPLTSFWKELLTLPGVGTYRFRGIEAHSMLRLLKKLRRNERGNVLILAGMAMPLIIGSAGLAVDGIQWALWKRQLQRAADSAALAAVYAKVQGASSQTPEEAVDYELGIGATAGTRRNASGFALTAANRAVTVATGTGYTNGSRVVLTVDQVPAFSSMFWPSMNIKAGATAATVETGVYCVVSLINTGATGITASGNADINLGCGMITNSTSMDAAIATGNSEVFATPVAAVGGIRSSDNWNGAELLPFTVKQDDPFAGISPPPPTDYAAPCYDLSVGPQDTVNVAAPTTAGKVTCFSSLHVQGNLTLAPGTYVINGGDVSANSGAKLSCTGCTFILTNSNSDTSAAIGDVDFNGGAEIKISASTTGTYKDILFYQDRRASSGTNTINGNSNSTFSGAMYFPKQLLRINGTSDLTFSCAQFVAWQVEFSGNTDIVNTCSTGYGTRRVMGRHVRLVA